MNLKTLNLNFLTSLMTVTSLLLSGCSQDNLSRTPFPLLSALLRAINKISIVIPTVANKELKRYFQERGLVAM